jgi:hypothetical protein
MAESSSCRYCCSKLRAEGSIRRFRLGTLCKCSVRERYQRYQTTGGIRVSKVTTGTRLTNLLLDALGQQICGKRHPAAAAAGCAHLHAALSRYTGALE